MNPKTTVRYFFIACISLFICSVIQAQGLKTFKLPNGLSVFIWEDHMAPDVHGMVVCNVGAKEDPDNLTGLAHYLEHVMFKGTQKIGALDWEKEKPLYEQIIVKYDEMAKESDPVKKTEINKEINKLTVEASQYSLSNEFSVITRDMGGYGLNATTSYDRTVYYNSFAPGDVYKWLDLNSERLINPVFRAFQTELETVFEEYNLYQNVPSRQLQEFLLQSIFPDHPYSRPLIGYPEHLKNPQLSGLVEFYNTWYKPSNMALILSGNVKTNELVPMIREKFGRLENQPVPEKKVYPDAPLTGRKELKAKIGHTPMTVLSFYGVPLNHEEQIALDICVSVLSNSSRTGLLDKLTIDGDFLYADADNLTWADKGRLLISAVPYYDSNQKRFNSLSSTEKMILKEIKKLQNGQFEDWLVESIKSNMIRQYDLRMEHPSEVTEMISEAYYSGQDMQTFLNYKEIVSSLTAEEIKSIAKKYFGNDYLVLAIEKGKESKTNKLEKPGYEPLKTPRGVKSDYAKLFELMPVKYIAPQFADMDKDVQIKQVNDRSKLFYTFNPVNNIFNLTLKFGIGTKQRPNLELASALMNDAGIMGQMEAQEVKQAFSDLGVACRYMVDDSYLYVSMIGYEENLQTACNLLARQILFPKLDEKQMDALKGRVYSRRLTEQESYEDQSEALLSYIQYKEKSSFIDRPTFESIYHLTIGNLTGEFQRATDYEAEIHYTGALAFDDVYNILNENLPLKKGEKETTSPEFKEFTQYTNNTIYFISDKDAYQANIYFFINGELYDKDADLYRNAFNQYLSGGFGGLITEEIREKRSLSYWQYGYESIPYIKGKSQHFIGYVGTQSDKIEEALDVYVGLLSDLPQYPEQFSGLKNYLKQTLSVSTPHFRNRSLTFKTWKQMGYTDIPSKEQLEKLNNFTFDDIVKYYNENVKGKPWAIGIIGDPAKIDTKALEKYGKVVKIPSSRLFSDK